MGPCSLVSALRPFVLRLFALNPLQLLDLRSHVFGLTPTGWLRSITLIHFSYRNINFYLRPLFKERN